MSKLRVYIVDDEKGALQALEAIVESYPNQLELVGSASQLKDALADLPNLKPDVLFLDIHVRERNGFELLSNGFSFPLEVIIVSAFDEYALKAYENQVLAYLLKPVSFSAFEKAIGLAQTVIKGKKELPEEVDSALTIQVPVGNRVDFFGIEQLIFVKADGSYCDLYLISGEKLTISKPLRFIEDQLTDNELLRVHRSYLVNPDKIVEWSKTSKPFVKVESGITIPVSRVGKAELSNYFS